MKFEAYETTNILDFVGSGLIRDSPLVVKALQNDTTPRKFTVYLERNGGFSFINCSTPKFNAWVNGNTLLRLALLTLIRDAAYVISELVTYELVAPVIDCSFLPILRGEETLIRVYYLMRQRANPNEMMLVAVRFSMQDFKIPEVNARGPMGFGHHQYIKDMRSPKVFKSYFGGAPGYPFEPAVSHIFEPLGVNDQGWWTFQTIPKHALDPPTRVLTACRTGFYVASDSEQSNIKNLHWRSDDDPRTVLSTWNWEGEPVLRDSWAWVHFLHVIFALDGVFNLGLLLLVIYRNLQQGKIWVGDAFMSISTTLIPRGLLILGSWVINGFWSLMEFCLHDAHALAGTQDIFFHSVIIRADLLTVYLALMSTVGYAVQERIDPAFAVIVFEVFFSQRLAIIKWFPSVLKIITDYAHMDQKLAVFSVTEKVVLSSPLRQWTTHPLPPKRLSFIFGCLLPIFSSVVVILIYVVIRKIARRALGWKDYVTRQDTSGPTQKNSDRDTSPLFKRTLTLFEIATGAELQSRFGIVADYDNCIIIKGMKYASADGIFCNGFVIVSGKYLVATSDLLAIIVMKVTRVRLQNVFVFEVTGNTVQQTARLVYPDTLSWSDLTHLNITILS
ncbi:hypothetical protein PINS_up007394 [Pythium insidiosum]|nr:hypothetical protein PINS_up007394 [Pythium insidiosum]